MAVELLRRQIVFLGNQRSARKKGMLGPLMLNNKQEAYHDLESLIWVLVYAMMLHHYNSLTQETDRKEYKVVIDHYFGHGSTETIIEKRQAMYLAHSRVGSNCVSRWFSDPRERKFFTDCMELIAENDEEGREEREKRDRGTFTGEIDDNNPELWSGIDLGMDEPPDEDTGKSGKYTPDGSRKRPAVITYQSVVALLKSSIKGP